jgi:hypothetical protein
MIRSLIAVLAGFAVMALVVMVSTVVAARLLLGRSLAEMHTPPSGSPSRAYLTANLAGSALAALLGGYTAAAIAGQAQLAHGVGLAAVMAIMAVISMRQAGTAQPRWYQLVLATVMPGLAIAGAGLRIL